MYLRRAGNPGRRKYRSGEVRTFEWGCPRFLFKYLCPITSRLRVCFDRKKRQILGDSLMLGTPTNCCFHSSPLCLSLPCFALAPSMCCSVMRLNTGAHVGGVSLIGSSCERSPCLKCVE